MDNVTQLKPTIRVLYIEDDPLFGQFVKDVLIRLNCKVDLAETGADGLSAYEAAPYDIVAVDYKLPDMTGLDVCIILRALTPDLPLVVITGRGKASTPVEALTLNIPHYLEKGTGDHFTEGLVNTFRHIIGTLK